MRLARPETADLKIVGSRRRPARSRSVSYRPQLEPLECRTAPATDLVVASLLDAPDANPLDGVAASTLPGGALTLRAAIMHANANPNEEFRILLPAGTITLTIPGIDEDQAAQGDLDIRVRLTIQGQAGSVVNGGLLDRVFHIQAGPTATVNFLDFTITGGSAQGFEGNSAEGGGISVVDTNLNLLRVHVVDNRAENGVGGGIDLFDSNSNPVVALTLRDSTVSGNFASFGGGGLSLFGNADLQNVTISGNRIGEASGGGILQFSPVGTLRLFHVTVAANLSDNDAGGIRNHSNNLVLASTILAGNSGGNYVGTQAISQGFNLDTDGTANLTQPTDRVGQANLSPLTNNGGPTPTHALLAGSLALNAADPNNFPATDQRGLARPVNTLPDIGAYEAGPRITVSGSVDREFDGQPQVFRWVVIDSSLVDSSAVFPFFQITVQQNGVPIFAADTAAGEFVFDDRGLGVFLLTVTATSRDGTTATAQRQVEVVDDDTAPPVIALTGRNGVFTWAVTDASLPLANVLVMVAKDGVALFQSGLPQGTFQFDAFGGGTYTLSVQAVDGDADWLGDSLAAENMLVVIVPATLPPSTLTAFPFFPNPEVFAPPPAILIVQPVPANPSPTAPVVQAGVDFLFTRFGVGGSPERTPLTTVILNRAFQELVGGSQGNRASVPGEAFEAGLPPENRALRGVYPLSDPVGAVLSPLDADDSVRLFERLRRQTGPLPTTPTGAATEPRSAAPPAEGTPSPPAPTKEPAAGPGRSILPILSLAAAPQLRRKTGRRKRRGKAG